MPPLSVRTCACWQYLVVHLPHGCPPTLLCRTYTRTRNDVDGSASFLACNCYCTDRVHRKSRTGGCKSATRSRAPFERIARIYTRVHGCTCIYIRTCVRRDGGTSHSRKSSHEYRVETTGASPRHAGIPDPRIILPRFDLGAMLNDAAEKERNRGIEGWWQSAGARGNDVKSWRRCFATQSTKRHF